MHVSKIYFYCIYISSCIFSILNNFCIHTMNDRALIRGLDHVFIWNYEISLYWSFVCLKKQAEFIFYELNIQCGLLIAI